MSQGFFLRFFGRHRRAGKSRSFATIFSRGWMWEGLEQRSMLAADLGIFPGDSDLNGVFDSADIVQVFQAGKFETGEAATWLEGDWNQDGLFNTSDIVYAFASSSYGMARMLATDVSTDDATSPEDAATDDTRTDGSTHNDGTTPDGTPTDDGTTTDGTSDDGNPDGGDCLLKGQHVGGRGEHLHGANAVSRLDRLIQNLRDQIANGDDLPGSLTAEAAQAIVDGLTAAVAAGDAKAVQGFLDQLRTAHKEDRVEAAIDQIHTYLEKNETLPGDLVREDIQSSLQSATDALASGDLAGAQTILHGIFTDIRSALRSEAADARIQARIDALNMAIADGTLPIGLSVDQANALIAAYTMAMESGDMSVVQGAMTLIRYQNLLLDLNAAVEEGAGYGNLTAADTSTLATSLAEALAAGDLATAQDLITALRPARVGGGHGGRHGRGHEPDGDDGDTTGDTTGDTNSPDGAAQAGAQALARVRQSSHGGRRR